MPFRVVRLGSPRRPDEGLRIGTVRRPPRGVRKPDYAKRDFYDVWLPELAPTAPLVSFALSQPWTDARWSAYARRYGRELAAPAARRLLELLAALSLQTNFAIGCYCEDPDRCHRSLLARQLEAAGGRRAGTVE